MIKYLLGILVILVLCFELYRFLRQNWISRLLKKKKNGKHPRKPVVMKPKSDQDCRFCVNEKGKQKSPIPETSVTWRLRKGHGGPKKKLSTTGYFCPNVNCEYYGISDESMHALVGYGGHGKYETI